MLIVFLWSYRGFSKHCTYTSWMLSVGTMIEIGGGYDSSGSSITGGGGL